MPSGRRDPVDAGLACEPGRRLFLPCSCRQFLQSGVPGVGALPSNPHAHVRRRLAAPRQGPRPLPGDPARPAEGPASSRALPWRVEVSPRGRAAVKIHVQQGEAPAPRASSPSERRSACGQRATPADNPHATRAGPGSAAAHARRAARARAGPILARSSSPQPVLRPALPIGTTGSRCAASARRWGESTVVPSLIRSHGSQCLALRVWTFPTRRLLLAPSKSAGLGRTGGVLVALPRSS